jgi:hypothetical protein
METNEYIYCFKYTLRKTVRLVNVAISKQENDEEIYVRKLCGAYRSH